MKVLGFGLCLVLDLVIRIVTERVSGPIATGKSGAEGTVHTVEFRVLSLFNHVSTSAVPGCLTVVPSHLKTPRLQLSFQLRGSVRIDRMDA